MAAGVKETVILQEVAAARDMPQLLVCAKLPALVPVMEMLPMVRAAVPGLDSVTGSEVAATPTVVLGNISVVGESVASGASAAVPVPVSVAVCGEPVALSATLMLADNVVALPGVKVTEMVQVAETASEAGQLFVWAKLLGLVPVIVMPVMVSAAVPGFESTVVSTAEVTPTAVFGNGSDVGVRTACGVGVVLPVPESAINWVVPVTFRALSVNVSVPVRAPVAVGAKSTPTTQEAPAAMGDEVEQVVVAASILKFVPNAMPVKVKDALPMF